MHRSIRLAGVVVLGAAALIGGSVGAQASGDEDGGGQAVFVQANDPNGNAIVAYRRNADGTLTQAASYPTGGKGGRTIGSASDPLASQGSLVYDRSEGLLLAVNAGTDSFSAFGVEGDTLRLNQVVSSGGSFPISFAVGRNLVYVLNAGSAGSVSGYRLEDGKLDPISGSTRSLGLTNTNPPFFLSSPAQVGFTRDGRHLVVTTKTNNTVDVFAVQPDGRLSSQPTVNAMPGVPFAFVFDAADRLVLVSAGTGSVSTLTVNGDGTLTPVGGPVSNGQAAACWIKPARGFDYVANTGSGTISQFRVDGSGAVTLVNAVAAGVPGAIDMAAADHGRFLYAESGGTGSLDAFGVAANGSLALIQTAAIPGGASLEGIIAT